MVLTKHIVKSELCALVVELVDTRDLKSLAGNSVPVQVRPWAPFTSSCSKLFSRFKTYLNYLINKKLSYLHINTNLLIINQHY